MGRLGSLVLGFARTGRRLDGSGRGAISYTEAVATPIGGFAYGKVATASGAASSQQKCRLWLRSPRRRREVATVAMATGSGTDVPMRLTP